MTESPYQLTVRVNLKSLTDAPVPVSGNYRWDRIVGVSIVVTLLVLCAVWMSGSSQPEIEIAASPVSTHTSAGVGGESAAASGSMEGRSEEPSEEPSKVEPEQKPVPVSSLGEPAVETAARPVAAEQSAILIAEADPGEQLTASADAAAANSPATPISPREPIARTSAAAPPAVTASAILRDPPITAISTRIVSPLVKRFLITDAVVSREPVGAAENIREDRKVKGLVKVIAYSEVSGHAGDTLRYLWLRRDKVVANVPVRVGSDSWRSYTSKFLNKDMRGRWWVELQTSKGDLLAVTEFEF